MNTVLVVAFMMLVWMAPLSVHAQSGTAAARLAQRDAMVQSLSRGPAFVSEDHSYQLLPEARAARVKKNEKPGQILQGVGARSTDMIDGAGTLIFFRRTAGGVNAARTEVVAQRQLWPVAIEPRSGLLVMLPGSIIAHPKNMEQTRQLAADHGLRLVRAYPHLNTAIYEVRLGQDVLAASQTLARDARVNRAEPEVISGFQEPR
jgi:hypothetical protein